MRKVILQRRDRPGSSPQCLDRLYRRSCAGDGGDHGDTCTHGHGPDSALVGVGSLASGGVEDDLDFAAADLVENVGPGPLGNLADELGLDAVFSKELVRSHGGDDI